MRRRMWFVAALLSAGLASSCQASAPTYRVHHLWLDGAVPSPARVLLLPAEVAILRMSTSALEPVPELSRQASADLTATLAEVLPGEGLELVDVPALSEEERARVEEHVLLFEAAAGAAFPMPADVPRGSKDGDLWWHEVERFDLELGSGLAFLAERSGARCAVMLAGAAIEPTGGRQALSVFGSLLGVYEQTSVTNLYLGVVDLATGAILWVGMHAEAGDWSDSADKLTEHDELAGILAGLLARYPGLAEYREACKRE